MTSDPELETLRPHSPENEAGALACIVSFPEHAPGFIGQLEGGDFYLSANIAIFRTLEAILKEAGRVDHMMLQTRLMATDRMNEAGGLAYVAGLPEKAGAPGAFPAFRDELKLLTNKRRHVVTLAGAMEVVRNPRATMSEIQGAIKADSRPGRRRCRVGS